MKQYKYGIGEIKRMTKSMIILVDSREKKNSHILGYFDKQGISYQVGALEYGDYSFMIPAAAGEEIYFHRDCVVERKASLQKRKLKRRKSRTKKKFNDTV